MIRIALGNVRVPGSPDDSLAVVTEAMATASREGAAIVCFPECLVPGYRVDTSGPEPDQQWLDATWRTVDEAAADLGIAVVLGAERVTSDGLRITARVTDSEGRCAGFQDKVQLDPSEEAIYTPGVERQVFWCGELCFGVVICHEGWRYPETVRWAARNGAQLVFHPHFEVVEHAAESPSRYADPTNTFHEKAALCRAAENTCYFASVNCAIRGAATTSAVIDPEGRVMAYQPYGEAGVLLADLDLSKATRLLANRAKPVI